MQWRFLDTGDADGLMNMAVDEVLATKSVPIQKVCVFRVYRWKPYTISLGFNQNPAELDLEKCVKDGIGVVRRPTGGRAVFHAEELTYSVIIPRESDFYSRDILTTYNRISGGLLEGLRLYGVGAEFVERFGKSEKSSDYKNSIPCFSSSAKYEIAYDNKKMVGSAQRRYENSILQHGSILTGSFHLKLADYIFFKHENSAARFKEDLEDKTISISQITGKPVDWEKLKNALKSGLEEKFNINFTKSQITPQEIKEAKIMIKTYPKIGGQNHEN
ncbi:hypothetical protein B6I21_07180 [candidate division KSB1 bacterium 4572_119]|nr:MAG: hypothetical protein B6I21_07180 [candidate division KSB1 bacterium 4572_119]